MWKTYEDMGLSDQVVHHRTIRTSGNRGIWAFGQFFSDRHELDSFRRLHFVEVKKQTQRQQPFGGLGGGGYAGCCTCQQGSAGPAGPPGRIRVEIEKNTFKVPQP